MFTITLPQSTKIQPDSTLPSTFITFLLWSFIDSTSLSARDFACLFEFAVAIIMVSAKEDMLSISKDKIFSALLSFKLFWQMFWCFFSVEFGYISKIMDY